MAGLFGMISSFLNPGKAYRKATEAMQPYYDQSQQMMQPFMQQGQAAYGPLSGAMNRLLDPASLQNEWAQGYQASPYAQQMQGMANQQGLEAASSLGLMGSSPALQAIQAGTSQIGAQDRERYLDSLMQKYLAGAGLAQNIYGQGAQAAGQMGQNAMNMGNFASEMAYGQQAAPGQLFGNLLGTAAGLGGSYMGMRGMNNLANAWSTRK